MTTSEADETSLRLVIDVVGFVRALINPRSAWGAIVFSYSDDFTLVTSDDVERELQDVLQRPEITRKLISSLTSLGTYST